MKRSILTFCFVSSITSSLLAQQFTNNPILKQTLSDYKKKSYIKSFIGFKKYLETNSWDKRVAFMLGRSAYEIGKYEEALVAFQKVLYVDPKNIRVRLEMAQTHFRMNNYEEAQKLFEDVLRREIPTIVRTNINLSLSSIKLKTKKHFFKTTLIAGYGYDSNVNNEPDAGDYTIYIPILNSNQQLSTSKKKSDQIMNLASSINHTYKIDNTLAIDNKLMGFTQKYSTYNEKDLDVIALGSTLSYYQKKYKLSLALDYNHIWLDDKGYMDNYIVTPSALIKINKKLDYSSELKLTRKDFIQDSNKDKNSFVYEFKNGLILTDNDYGINSFYLTLGKERKRRGSRTDVNQYHYGIQLDNKYPLSKTVMLINTIDYSKTNYKDMDVNFLTKRKDTRYGFSSTIVKSVSQGLAVGAVLNLTDVTSNHKPNDYNKYSVKTNVFYNF